MADLLAGIVARKRREVAGAVGASHAALVAAPPVRSLRAAIARPGARFVMEVKRKSPSGHRARHSLEAALAAYRGLADAVSVLVDGPDFGGSLDDLRAARDRFDGPILAKEFLVDPVQVGLLRAAGADAVLVLMNVLDDAGAAAMIAEAARLGMEALVEVHDEDELARALALGARLIGINNRDLRTMAIDLATTERLAPLVPASVALLSLSGVRGPADVARLAPHVDGFLVGSSLMAAERIERAARALLFGEVKICGLTRVEDVAAAARAGASEAGFIFHPDSPRRVTREEATVLVGAARNAGLRTVGVFAACDPEAAALARDLGLDAIQLHGPGAPAGDCGGAQRIAVRSVRDGRVDPPVAADRILFDHRGGGSGEPFDWSLVQGDPQLGGAFLAGGIGPANAARARAVGAAGLDLSSGVESAPGIKDETKLAALFAALRPEARTMA